MSINHNELKLFLVPGVGPANFYKIKNALQDNFSDIFSGDSDLLKSLNLPLAVLNFLTTQLDFLDAELEKELQYIEKHQIKVISSDDVDYPENLKNIYQPPPFLFAKGDVKKLNNKSFAIVGTRFPSDYGKDVTKNITQNLIANGITIVSGLARGIDAVAHKTALEGGETIAVIGNGFKYIYPSENRKLYENILEENVIVSELPFEALPDKCNFPARNRIISGLSQGVLVVEANEKSGSLITASHAADQGKDIFAIPGEITNPRAAGTNKLIKDGAKIVLDANDILEELFNLPRMFEVRNKSNKEALKLLDEIDRKIFDFIDDKRTVHFEEIALSFEININTLMSILLTLQMKNFIKELPGKFYCIDN